MIGVFTELQWITCKKQGRKRLQVMMNGGGEEMG